MKQIIHGMVAFAVLFATVAILLSLNGKRQRDEEITETLSAAVETTLQNLLNDSSYDIEDNEELVADFLQALLVQLGSETDVEVNVLHADAKKGLLSIEVNAVYQHPNGKKGHISCCRTILFDTKEVLPAVVYTVTYYYDKRKEDVYKEYRVLSGEKLPVPKNPRPLTGTGIFSEWKNRNDDTKLQKEQTVNADLSFYAVFTQ